ncbi:hypothetical protein BC829DRAFT_172291 [Chytridium lagenaria]|nr:hypothetical protein BC829DRAFT_172291 [Chytridium lagenaria]
MYEQFMAYKTLFDDGNFVCSIVGNDDGASQTRRRKSNARLDKESLLNGDSTETMELDNYKHSLEVHVQIKGASSNEHLSLCFSFVYPSEVVAVSSALIGGRRTFSLDSLFREEDSIDDRANSCYTLRIGDEDLKSYFWAKIVSGGTMNGMGADPSSLKVPERGSGMKIHVAKLMRAIKARYKAWNLFNSEVNKECGASRGSTDHSRGRFISVTFLTEEESSRETTRGGLFWVFDLAASAAKVREYHFTIHVPVEFPDRRCFFGVKSLPVSCLGRAHGGNFWYPCPSNNLYYFRTWKRR